MIPKKIHYCWFGGNSLPDELKTYIDTWKKYCPDYEIIEWNETNFDVNKYRYSKEAYQNKKWAFVSDVARLDIIYNYGGIYLDTDVEIVKSFDPLLSLKGFIGGEDKYDLNTGAGFGAEKNHPIVLENLKEYSNLSLVHHGKLNGITCVELTTRVLKRHGYKKAVGINTYSNMTVFPVEYFSPLKLSSNKLKITNNTYSIHYFTTNWKKRSDFKKVIVRRTVFLKKYIRRNIDDIFGEGTYSRIKIKFKKIEFY